GGTFPKRGSISYSSPSQTTLLGCPSSSSVYIYVDEPREVVLPAFGWWMRKLPPCNIKISGSLTLAQGHAWTLLCEALTSQDVMYQVPSKSLATCGKQTDITNCMRIILVDWLVEVDQEAKLCGETSTWLSTKRTASSPACLCCGANLQLVGTAAILLAAEMISVNCCFNPSLSSRGSKDEGIYTPEVDDFVYITDDTYTKKQDTPVPPPFPSSACWKWRHSCSTSLSMMAAAAFCLANYTLNTALRPEALCIFAGYTLAEITPCLKDLHKMYLSTARPGLRNTDPNPNPLTPQDQD
ncbi:unnamed protein product, partial [Coregonus sp. 'balchen']